MRALNEQFEPSDGSVEYVAVGDRCGPRQGFGGTNDLGICRRPEPVDRTDGPDNRAAIGATASKAGYRVGTYRGITAEMAKPNL